MMGNGPPDSRARALAITALMGATLVLGTCGASGATKSPPVLASESPSAIPTPSASPATASASPASVSASPDGGASSFPPSQVLIEPGTYRWGGFERPITLALADGWALGHDNPTFFDLFRGSEFPAVTFARFTDVYETGTTRTAATSASAVVALLLDRPDLTLSEPVEIEVAGMSGLQFDLTTPAPKTPVFFGTAGDFRLDPEFKTRYRVLDFPTGGVLVIGTHAAVDALDAAVALADPVVMSLSVEP